MYESVQKFVNSRMAMHYESTAYGEVPTCSSRKSEKSDVDWKQQGGVCQLSSRWTGSLGT